MFTITAEDVATLAMLNIRIMDMIFHDEVNAEILPEVQFLQRGLDDMIHSMKNKA